MKFMLPLFVRLSIALIFVSQGLQAQVRLKPDKPIYGFMVACDTYIALQG